MSRSTRGRSRAVCHTPNVRFNTPSNACQTSFDYTIYALLLLGRGGVFAPRHDIIVPCVKLYATRRKIIVPYVRLSATRHKIIVPCVRLSATRRKIIMWRVELSATRRKLIV